MVRAAHPLKHLLLGAVMVMMVLAGCVAPEGPGESAPEATTAPTPEVRYACPPGDTLTLSNGLCVTTFADPRETFEEPYLGVDPNRPEVMVLGMNAWHADPRPVLRGGVPSLEVGKVALFVTQDGGAVWQPVESPPILYGTGQVGKTSYSGDPVLEFDMQGVLHYLQTSVSFDQPDGEGFPYIDIQYARSEDLGASWSVNKLLADDGDNDRPWLTVGPGGDLFATWRDNMIDPDPPQLAWSKDGGTTWQIFTAPAECTDTGRAIVDGDSLLMPCALKEGENAIRLQINRFDLTTNSFEALAQLPAPQGDPTFTYTQWDRSPDGGVLALATRTDSANGFVVFSRDSGAAWSKPLLFVDLCACEPETGSLHLLGATFDAVAGLHLLLGDAVMANPDSWDESNTRYASGNRALFHVVVDAGGNTLLSQKLTTSTAQDPRTPPSAAAPVGKDDYYVPAFWADRGAIAWTRDKGIDLTYVKID